MKFTSLRLAVGLSTAFGFAPLTASAEELSVATFVPPQHHTNTIMFKWFGEEIAKRSGGSLTMKLYPAGQLGAVERSKAMLADAGQTYGWIVVSDEERAKMITAVAAGLEKIIADYESRGIAGARKIYGALNQ